MKHVLRLMARRSAIASAAAALFGPAAYAQQVLAPDAPASGPAADAPQRITITGSNIKRIDTEGVVPVQVITAEDIRRSGYTTITDVLRSQPAAAQGGLSESSGSSSFSAGASSISLRGLGSQATLVLLNGRRISTFAPADPNFGQAASVNLDSLPLEVIDRVEILTEGASAIYGSEAIAGVVNIITKQEFSGGVIAGTGSINTHGDYKNVGGNLTYGLGDLGSDKYNIFATFEYNHRYRTSFDSAENFLIYDAAKNSSYRIGQRLFSSYSPTGNYYAAVFDPTTLGSAFYYQGLGPADGCPPEQIDAGGVCRFDIFKYQSILSERSTYNLFSRGTIQFTPTLSGFTELSYNKTKQNYINPPQIYGDIGSWYASGTGQTVNIPEVLPPGNPSNPTDDYIGYRHRFAEVGPRDNSIDSDALRVVTGLKGTVLDWDYESALSYSGNWYKSTSNNEIRRSVLTDAVINGTYNFLDPSAGSTTPDDLRIDSTDKARSYYAMIDGKASRELTQLDGGPLAIAIGAEFRHEKRVAAPDINKQIGEVVGFGAASAEGDRNVSTGYAELSIPFVKDVDMQLAARVDHYNDYGTSTNPKVALGWKVTPEFRVRGSYETGFRAPSLTEIAKSSVSAFTTVTDPKRCVNGDEDDCSRGIGVLIQANPDLDPEKSRGYNLGFVVQPASDLSASVDYFDIRRRKQVDTLSLDDILRNEDSTDPKYAGRVQRGPVDPNNPDLPGPIQAISTGYFNLGKTEVAGVDLDLRYLQRLEEYGTLRLRTKVTEYTKFKQSSDTSSPMVDYLGYFDQPRTRGLASVEWEVSGLTSAVTANYVSGYKTYNPAEVDPFQCDFYGFVGLDGKCQVRSWTTWDLSFAYDGFKDISLGLVVQNIFNDKPPFDPSLSVGTPYYNSDFHNPYGRYFTVTAKYSF